MKIRILFVLCFLTFSAYTQEIETINIIKKDYKLYRGVLKETNAWYLFEDLNGRYYLANIDPAISDIHLWFERFKSSLNIYKSVNNSSETLNEIGGNMYRSLVFMRENDPENRLSFYIEKPEKTTIVLISISDNNIFTFELVDE